MEIVYDTSFDYVVHNILVFKSSYLWEKLESELWIWVFSNG